MLEPRRQRNFSDQQTGDIQAELERIKRVTHLEALHQSLRNRSTVKAEEKKAIDTMEYLTKKSGRFADQDQQDFDRAMKSVEHLSTLPGLGINESERVAIVKALNMGRGHWYACPKGHPYLITEVYFSVVKFSALIELFFYSSLVRWSQSDQCMS